MFASDFLKQTLKVIFFEVFQKIAQRFQDWKEISGIKLRI